MAKVKKTTGVTGVRNVKAGNTAIGAAKAREARVGRTSRRSKAAEKAATSAGAQKTTAKAATSAGTQKTGKARSVGGASPAAKRSSAHPSRAGRRTGQAAKAPAVRVAVRELDPQRKCGDGTSVQLLYRVDETVDGRATAHLVFFDRHGWYCEHGRTCPAVAHARKHNGQFARVS